MSDFRNQTQINDDQIKSKSVDTQGAQGGSPKSDDWGSASWFLVKVEFT